MNPMHLPKPFTTFPPISPLYFLLISIYYRTFWQAAGVGWAVCQQEEGHKPFSCAGEKKPHYQHGSYFKKYEKIRDRATSHCVNLWVRREWLRTVEAINYTQHCTCSASKELDPMQCFHRFTL